MGRGCYIFKLWKIVNFINHHRRNEEPLYIQGQRDLQTHSNANIEELCQSQEYPWCLLNIHSQTSSLFLHQSEQCGSSRHEGDWERGRTGSCNSCTFSGQLGHSVSPSIGLRGSAATQRSSSPFVLAGIEEQPVGFGRRVASEPVNEKELEPWVSDKKKKTLFLAFSSLLRNDMVEIEFLRSCGVKTEERNLKIPVNHGHWFWDSSYGSYTLTITSNLDSELMKILIQ